MAISYEATGRTRQKARTRDALVAAGRELLADGVTPTVEQAADGAGVGRATAYRYFANQRELLLATYPELDAPSLVPSEELRDPAERLDAMAAELVGQIVDHEQEMRTMLRLSLEPGGAKRDLPFRKGRRITWVADALEPLRADMSAKAFDRLAISIAAVLGIEALVWLTDIAGLSRAEAAAIMRSNAAAILHSALAD